MEFKFESGELNAWLKATPSAIRAGARRALRRTGTAVQAAAVNLFRQRGVGRSVFGKRVSGVRLYIKRGRFFERPGVIGQPVRAIGLAAIQEVGGRIEDHVIVPKNRKMLAFPVKGAFGFGGDLAFAKEVHHPGAQHPKMPYLQRAAESEQHRFKAALEVELDKALKGKKA